MMERGDGSTGVKEDESSQKTDENLDEKNLRCDRMLQFLLDIMQFYLILFFSFFLSKVITFFLE